MRGSPSPLPPITTKDELVARLYEASMLEHQFMCQYLYAAFSLKKAPDATCNEAQFERVRRWASTIYLVARQEMEHLSIVTSILTATGAGPYLGHLDFPTLSRWFTRGALHAKRSAQAPPPCDMPFVLERFTLNTARRFCCMEAPHQDHVPADEQAIVQTWCYQDPSGRCPCVAVGAPTLAASPPAEVEPGTIQDLYDTIEQGLRYLAATIGEPALFSGHCSGQSEIPSEYMIYLFPICDLRSALAGLKMAVEQGEGIDAPPLFDSHFRLFFEIAREYELLLATDPGFAPSLPVPLDPPARGYTDPVTALAAGVFHDGYLLLLEMLTGYYQHYTKTGWQQYPYLSAALEQSAFAPMMTMLVRSLAEVIVQLPANDGGPAGVSFDLSHDELAFLGRPQDPLYADIGFYLRRAEALVAGLAELKGMVPAALQGKVTFIWQNLTRVTANLAFNYQKGIYPRFDPNANTTCPPATGCDCE